MITLVSYQVHPDQGGYMLFECTLENGMRCRRWYANEEEAQAERKRLNAIELEYQRDWGLQPQRKAGQHEG
jgi:hypothetical protein